MTCNPVLVSELPGSYLTCAQLIVRECLSINGIDVVPGAATVHTDGVTLQGVGSLASPVALKAVQHDGTMTGLGTVASPLSVPAGPPATVITDGVTVQGDGSGGAPVALKRVQADDSMAGAGTVLSPLTVQKTQGLAGIVDASQAFAGVPVLTVTSVDGGGIAIQAQDSGGAGGGRGTLALTCDGQAGLSSLDLGSRTNAADINIGTLVGATHDKPKMFMFDLKDCGALANIGVGPAGAARFAYELATNKVYVSLNGAAFVAVVTL